MSTTCSTSPCWNCPSDPLADSSTAGGARYERMDARLLVPGPERNGPDRRSDVRGVVGPPDQPVVAGTWRGLEGAERPLGDRVRDLAAEELHVRQQGDRLRGRRRLHDEPVARPERSAGQDQQLR